MSKDTIARMSIVYSNVTDAALASDCFFTNTTGCDV
jgi:hypothetical protein